MEDVEVEEQEYRPIATFANNPPNPLLRCKEYLQQMAPSMPGILLLDRCIDEASRVTEGKLGNPEATLIQDPSMVFAIVIYTFDVCLVDPAAPTEGNFYRILNSELRKREPAFLRVAHGYMYYLMTGLFRLPPVGNQVQTVYRGIDHAKATDARAKLRMGKRLHWSGFSSTSKNDTQARSFAQGGGLLLRIRLLPEGSFGRDISNLSAIRSEEEILLLPNIPLFVASVGIEDGIDVIDLSEMSPGPTEIDF